MNPIQRAYDAALDVSDGERTVVATINTDGVDRFKTVILPEGGDFAAYRRNPVVCANHDVTRVPIGRNLWIKSRKDRLIAKTQFLPEGTDELADKIFRLYQLEFLRAWSVNFTPIEWGRPTPQEVRKHPEWAGAEVIYRRWTLLEYSAVTVPGNADAITEACSRGLALPGWPPAGELFPGNHPTPTPALPPIVGRTLAQVEGAIRRQVRAEARAEFDRAVKDARELARGMI